MIRRVLVVGGTVVAVGAVVAAATGFGLGAFDSDDSPTAYDARPPATAKVARQTLLDRQTETGTLGYGAATTINGRLAGTITALPAVGTVIQRGEAVYRVDDTPVVLLLGTLPAYRSLAVGVEGADVKQLEDNLAALGYTGFTVDEEFTSGTATAVKAWQEDLGLAETGSVDPGRVVYAPAAIRVGALKAAVGEAAQPGQQVLTWTGQTRVVTVDLELSEGRFGKVGTAVQLTLPGGKTAEGTVSAATTVVDDGSGQDAAPTTSLEVTVDITDQTAVADYEQASVAVAFVASRRENVLTVPVAALLALAEGGYAVQLVEGTATRLVAVETGLFAGGTVEVSGPDLREGLTVGVPA